MELSAYLLLAFILGRFSVGLKIYIGSDQKKYDAATFGIKLRKRK